MDQTGFRQFLQTRQLTEEMIALHIALGERFEAFSGQPPSSNDARRFVAQMVQEKADTYPNLLALARFGRFTRNNAVFLVALELLDGAEVMGNLYDRLGREVGEQVRDTIFEGIERPTWGTPNKQKAHAMKTVLERFERLVDAVTVKRILSDCLRDLPDESYLEGKQKYLEAGGFDAFLEQQRQEFLHYLEQLNQQKGLYFNQEITAEVLDFVRGDAEISQGVRQGNILYVTKIPYMAKEYLAESNAEKKRYYYCHCPWARESLRDEAGAVSATFCQCRRGLHEETLGSDFWTAPGCGYSRIGAAGRPALPFRHPPARQRLNVRLAATRGEA